MRRKLLLLAAASAIAAAGLWAPPAEAQRRANEIVWGDQLPGGLDPHVIADVPMQFIQLNVYDELYRYQGNPPDLVPWLATGHTVSADGLTWTFTLRPGTIFHDGTELTAEDVVYSFQRVLALRRGPSAAFLPILDPSGITAPDRQTVRFQLKSPYAPFLAAIPLVAILNSKLVKANERNNDWGTAWLASNAAGSGAYRLDPATYRPQELADLPRNAEHFMGWSHNPRPIELIRSRPILETTTRVNALLRGDIDATDSYLPTDMVERVARARGVRVARDESMRVMVIRMNNQRAPFDNANFRRCLSHAFNYQGFISGILKDYAVRNGGPIPKNLWGAPADVEGYPFDLEKARAACDQARAEGAPVNREIEIHIQSQLAQTTQAAELFQSDLRRIGITMKIVPSTWPTLTTSTGRAETTPDMWVHWVSTYFVDPENWIGQMYDSQFHGTWKASSWYKNDEVDRMLREARAITDQSRRKQLYEQASRIVVADAADIWIYNTVQLRGLSNRVQGYQFSPVGSGGELRGVSLSN
ncbi:ABC transporter substrate-binding protein [Elioraea sp.]|uniref:ABC transporter substrate-binding protein n=1 Tax=Elioraea sp. TaxID=2185103 RepID=UPI003F716C94